MPSKHFCQLEWVLLYVPSYTAAPVDSVSARAGNSCCLEPFLYLVLCSEFANMECTHEGGIEASFLEQNAPDLCQSTGFSLSKGLRIQCRREANSYLASWREKKKKNTAHSQTQSQSHISWYVDHTVMWYWKSCGVALVAGHGSALFCLGGSLQCDTPDMQIHWA